MVPCSRPRDFPAPSSLADVVERGDDHRVLFGKLLLARAGVQSGGAGSGQQAVLGRISGPLTRARAKALLDGEGGVGGDAGASRGAPRKGPKNQHGQEDKFVVWFERSVRPGLGRSGQEVHLRGSPCASKVLERPMSLDARHGKLHTGQDLLDAKHGYRNKVIEREYRLLPVKKVPVRVAKYDVNLRESPLRAVQAMHAILTHMVLNLQRKF